jgi:hypothetical protein
MDLKLLICEDFLTEREAIELLINETKYDIIKYPYRKKILFLNISFLECDNNGKYYYDYELKRDCDIATEFIISANGLNVNFTFICGLKEYKIDDLKEIIPVKLRITFNEIPERNEKNQEIIFSYSKYLCNRNLSCLIFNNLNNISLMV